MRAVVIAHKILIASAAAFSLFLCIWGVLRYRRMGDTGSLLLGVFAGVVVVGLVLYFRTINRRYGKLLQRDTPQ